MISTQHGKEVCSDLQQPYPIYKCSNILRTEYQKQESVFADEW